MTHESIYKQLELWKKVLLIETGAAATLLATAFSHNPYGPFTIMWGWLGIWLALEIISLVAGLGLLVLKEWNEIALSDRLNPSFGFLTLAWFGLLAMGIYGWNTPLFLLLLLAIPIGIALYLYYRRLQIRLENTPEEIFP
jgi:hypothetical protein